MHVVPSWEMQHLLAEVSPSLVGSNTWWDWVTTASRKPRAPLAAQVASGQQSTRHCGLQSSSCVELNSSHRVSEQGAVSSQISHVATTRPLAHSLAETYAEDSAQPSCALVPIEALNSSQTGLLKLKENNCQVLAKMCSNSHTAWGNAKLTAALGITSTTSLKVSIKMTTRRHPRL
jgi:hypothetical protein